MSLHSNTLFLEAILSVYANRIELAYIQSDRLLWLNDSADVGASEIIIRINDTLVSAINQKVISKNSLKLAATECARRISKHLKESYTIICDVCINIVLQEEASDAINILGKKIEEFTNIEMFDVANVLSCKYKSIDEVAIKNASELSPEDVFTTTKNVQPCPGSTIHMEIGSKKSIRLEAVRLMWEGREITSAQYPTRIEADSFAQIHLPPVPIKMYDLLSRSEVSKGVAEIKITGRNDWMESAGEIAIFLEPFKVNMVTRFLDIGSSISKYMELTHQQYTFSDENAADSIRSDVSHIIRESIKADSEAIGVFIHNPIPTPTFTVEIGLPQIDKDSLDKGTDDELVFHFVKSVRQMAVMQYKKNRGGIGNIYWAFPDTKARNFKTIETKANELLEGSILGRLAIIREAECPRLFFGEVLSHLADAGKQAFEEVKRAEQIEFTNRQKLAEVKQAWSHYHRSGIKAWFERQFSNKPANPDHIQLQSVTVPTLEEWHRKFASLDSDEGLSEYLVIDAGGYSLDVHGEFPSVGKKISKSFAAGSNRINKIILDKFRSANPDLAIESCLDRAESIKCDICSEPEVFKDDPYYDVCKMATSEIYDGALDEILGVLTETRYKKGFPIIISGGGSKNQFLCGTLAQKLSAADLKAVPINSYMLYQTLHQHINRTRKGTKLFLNIASGFRPNNSFPEFAPYTDILGGLARVALDGQ